MHGASAQQGSVPKSDSLSGEQRFIDPREILAASDAWPVAPELARVTTFDSIDLNLSVLPAKSQGSTRPNPATTSLIAAAVQTAPVREFFGGILIVQERVGLAGKSIEICKIRTMHRDVSVSAEIIAEAERSGPGGKIAHDPRVTRIGKILRQFGIDELPQILSVLKGD